MSMHANISLHVVKSEIAACSEDAEFFGWVISPLDEVAQQFSVRMAAPKDREVYTLSFTYDNYPAWPYLIDFIDPVTGIVGTIHAYPASTDSFFNRHSQQGVICHPCSRKSYAGYTGLHGDWSIANWRSIAGSLTDLHSILNTIYSRISNKMYNGRMV